jgi:hypothetical protein
VVEWGEGALLGLRLWPSPCSFVVKKCPDDITINRSFNMFKYLKSVFKGLIRSEENSCVLINGQGWKNNFLPVGTT